LGGLTPYVFPKTRTRNPVATGESGQSGGDHSRGAGFPGTLGRMFEGFELATIEVAEASIRLRHGGSGPPVLLLHGHPQTHVMWHKIAPLLARNFTVVAADLRGYGDSSKPETTPDHEPYSKRAMARDQVEVMARLGFEEFSVVGHDRGARCAYRMTIDYPDRVRRLAVLDIVPTGEAFRRTDMSFALDWYHWFFLAQPFDLPERLITPNPDAYYFADNKEIFDSKALDEYMRCARDPKTIHAFCEDYRAGATYDFALDEHDRGSQLIQCPVLVLWSAKQHYERWFDVLDVWRDWAANVEGEAIDCGHYIAEEAPSETYERLRRFLT
jgi:haloacetate dehalogenase